MNSFPRSSSCLFPARTASHLNKRNRDCGVESDSFKRSRTVHDFSVLISFCLIEERKTENSRHREEQSSDDFFKPLRITEGGSFKLMERLQISDKNIESIFPSPKPSSLSTTDKPACEFQADKPLSA
jgi:hypothetical protein